MYAVEQHDRGKMQPIDQLGYFWLAGHEDDCLSGRLLFDPAGGGITLTLVGRFDHAKEDGGEPTVRLMGWLGNDRVTLDRAYLSNDGFRAPGLIESSYYANRMFVGHHLEQAQLSFQRAMVTITDLDSWVGKSGISKRQNRVETSTGFDLTYEMRYDPLPEESHRFSRGKVTLGFAWKPGGDPLRGISFRQWPVVRIEYDGLQSFETIQADVSRIQSLVTLCVDAPTTTESLTVSRPDIESKMLDGSDSGHPQLVEYLALPLRHIEPGKQRLRHPFEMLVSYDDVGGVAGIARWLDVSERFRRALDSVMSIHRAKHMFAENRFLNVTFAAEAFHRITQETAYMDEAAFDALLEGYLATTPEEHHEWLRGKIGYGNEPPLRKRLMQLATRAGKATRPIIGDKSRWAQTLKDVRNELTHVGAESQEFDGGDLFFLTESVYAVVRVCMLLESGVPLDLLTEKAGNASITRYRERLHRSLERIRTQLATR
jgi:hypothetical protein